MKKLVNSMLPVHKYRLLRKVLGLQPCWFSTENLIILPLKVKNLFKHLQAGSILTGWVVVVVVDTNVNGVGDDPEVVVG